MSLEKIAQYKEEIEKIASRAWKRNLGKIGEKGVEKLVDSGVLNRKKELKGLRRGTHNILRKENAKMLRKPEHFAGIGVRNARGVYGKGGYSLDTEDVSALSNQFKNMGAGAVPDVNVKGVKHKGIAHVPKDADKRVTSMINNSINTNNEWLSKKEKAKTLKGISRKDREAKKWQQAIYERHEADEVRFGNKVMNSKKHTMNINGMKGYTTQYGSHMTPKVLVAESSNVALAPKATKDKMKHLRNYNQKSDGYKNTEMGGLKHRSGGKFQYGESAVYDKKLGKKLENSVSKSNKQDFRAMGYDI